MKHLFSILLFTSFFIKFSFGQSQNLCDGPYVFYKDNRVLVKSINSFNQTVLDSFSENEKIRHPLHICFSNHPGWDFTVTLRKTIQNEPCTYKTSSRIFAVSDIEGEFENFRALLIAGKVMDSLYQWTFGTGNLIICGDLFDRGNDVVPELWLLYKLEDEARAKGGYVNTILGNHDIMNMSGDLRYVQPKYFDHAKILGQDYMELYAKDTELGRWLRSKNIIEKIGENFCLHGGMSPEVFYKKMSLEKINESCRPYYDQSKNVAAFPDSNLRVFFGRNAPFWYRGYFMDPRASQGLVDSTLAFYKCSRIIVGHTITDSNIADYYNHKIIGLDVDEHDGHTEAIIIGQNGVFTSDKTGLPKPIQEGPANPVVQ